MNEVEAESQRLRETLRLLTDTRKLMVRASDPRPLMADVCRLLVDIRHYPLVWIGLAREGDRQVQPVARAGVEADYLDSVRVSWDESPSGMGPTGRAIRTQTPVALSNPAGHAAMAPWRDLVLKHNLQAIASIPMRLGENAVGALTAYSADPRAFDEAEIELLQSAADDLAHGLHRLQIEAYHRKRIRQVGAIRELTEAMVSQRHMPTLLKEITRKAIELLDATGAGVYLVEPDGCSLRCVVSLGFTRDYTDTVLAFGEGVAGEVAQARQPIIVPDYHTWVDRAQRFDDDPSFVAVMGAPMIWQAELLGVLDITRSQDELPFSGDDKELLGLFANQAAVVLESAHRFQEAQDSLSHLQQLHEITRAALTMPDPESLAPSLARCMCSLASAQGCCLRLWNKVEGKAALAATVGVGARLAEYLPPDAGQQLAEQVLGFGHPIQVTEVPEANEHGVPGGSLLAAHSLLLVPLIAGDDWLGSMELVFPREHRFEKEDIQLAEQGGSLVALALARANAFEAERRHTSALEAVRQAGLRMTSSLELQPVLENILDSALRMLQADDAHIFLYDGQALSFGAARTTEGALSEPYASPRPDGITSNAARSGAPIVVPNTRSSPLFAGWDWDGAIVSQPIRTGGRVLGVMNVAFLKPHDFTEDDLWLLELLEDQAALALQNVSLYEEMDGERRRQELLYSLAREISSTLNIKDLLDRALALTADHLGAISATACLVHPTSGDLSIAAAYKLQAHTPESLEARLNAAPGKGLQGWVVANRKPALIGDVLKDERWERLPEEDHQGGAAMAAPIEATGQILGVLTIYAGLVSLGPEHLGLLTTVGQQVGLAFLNAQRYQQIERNLAELRAVQQVGRVVNQRLELQQLLQEVIDQLSGVLGYPHAEVLLVDGEMLEVRASTGALKSVGHRIPLIRGVVGRTARTDQASFLPDVSRDSDYDPAVADTRCEIAVPLHKGGVVVGVLNVESTLEGDLTESDLRLLTLLADQISIAIENAALYERLRRYAAELETKVAERTAKLAEALQQAREADQMKTLFVADVSHELRTPLTNIRLYLELLETAQGDRATEYMRTLDRETDRLVALIEDLLSISRLDAGTAAVNPRKVDINTLARSLVEDRQRLSKDRKLTLRFEPEDGLPLVDADEHMLAQVVANLLTNAMNYTPADGTITVQTALRADGGRRWLTLTVSDNGIGIPEEEQPKVFDRFYRGTSSRQLGIPGTGLGLAICQEIVRRHNGRITLVSGQGEGASFTLWLPEEGVERRPDQDAVAALLGSG
jgi:GAF domain-containing protein